MDENDPQPEVKAEEVQLAVPPAVIEKAQEKVATANLTESEDEEEIFVAARTAQEMNLAQKKLISWAEKKVEKMRAEKADAEKRLEAAKKQKYATEPYKRQVSDIQKKVDFYEKIKAALDAGYTIIPDMPMDVFAIRTTRKKPLRKDSTGTASYGGPSIRDQESNNPPAGEGKFVQPGAFTKENRWTGKDRDGKPVEMMTVWASSFDEQIDFPFKFARPTVMNATAQALSEKIFDELGAAPAKNVARKGDPMVIGRIFYKKGWHQKGISFLVSWFINSKDL